jgi:hypothetical protein
MLWASVLETGATVFTAGVAGWITLAVEFPAVEAGAVLATPAWAVAAGAAGVETAGAETAGAVWANALIGRIAIVVATNRLEMRVMVVVLATGGITGCSRLINN